MTNDLERNKGIQDDEISLKELILKIREWWSYLWSKKIIIIGAGIIGGALGLGYSFTKKPIYTATTTFVLESGEKGGGLGAYAGVASMMGLDIGNGGGIFQGDNIIELYKSRAMIEKTLLTPVNGNAKELLIDRYIEFNNWKEGWKDKPELLKINFGATMRGNRLRDSLLGKVVNDININYLSVAKPDKKLSIIRVDVRSGDEQFAKLFEDQLVKNVNEFYLETKTKKSIDNINILTAKRDSVQKMMNKSIYSAVAISDATPNANPTRQVQSVAPIQRAQFSAETNKAMLGEMVKNLEMSKLALMKETPLIQVIDEPIYPLQKDKFGKAKGLVLGGFIFAFLVSVTILIKYEAGKYLND